MMYSIIDAMRRLDRDTISDLSKEAGLALLTDEGNVPALLADTGKCLVEATDTAESTAIAGLALGYIIARHEIGEKLLGGETDG